MRSIDISEGLFLTIVIPVRDEAATISTLIESIDRQTLKPNEIVIVDGGSTDDTVSLIERIAADRQDIHLVKTDGASPGRGRNLGFAAARNDWIAFTDAGITLKDDWLEQLWSVSDGNDIVYGNFSPVRDRFFTQCAALAYVPGLPPTGIRGKFIASSLIKKAVCEAVGGFPDRRAAEDLIFMEEVEKTGARIGFAPNAMVQWQLRPDIASTFQKFVLYSKHNVWVGRQWDWHYGILRKYLLLPPFVALAVFHSWWWLLALPLWLLARTARRIAAHRHELGFGPLFNPLVLMTVSFLVLVIDSGTFFGWLQARISVYEGNA